MPLFIGGQALSVPHHGDSVPAEELFGEVCSKFRISEKIGKFLATDEGLANLDDFVHRFASEDEISTFVKAIPEIGARAGVETSRLRQAWIAARAASAAAEGKKRKGVDDHDLDTLLPAPDLSEIKTTFYNRYKLRFPVHVEPGDQLVSRLAREVSRRQLGVFSVWKVRTLVHQLKAPCKRQRLSDTVEMITHERSRSASASRLAARCRGAGTTAKMSRRGHFRLTSPGITL